MCPQAQRARGKLIREVEESFKVDAFVGNATDWEKVCMSNLVGMPVIVVPTGFTQIPDPPSNQTRRRTTVTTGIYAPPDHDHIVSLRLTSLLKLKWSCHLCFHVIVIRVGYIYGQALALAMAYQSVTNHHKQRPPIDDIGPNDSIPNPPKAVIPPRQLRG